jgi:hypothetical protein
VGAVAGHDSALVSHGLRATYSGGKGTPGGFPLGKVAPVPRVYLLKKGPGVSVWQAHGSWEEMDTNTQDDSRIHGKSINDVYFKILKEKVNGSAVRVNYLCRFSHVITCRKGEADTSDFQ